MKKYLLLVIGVVAIITMGSTVAITLEANNLVINRCNRAINNLLQQIFERFPNMFQINRQKQILGGGCGGGGGCHNNSNMTEITGTLVYENSNFKIDTTILNFGCYNYINSTTSPYDFDGDGTIEKILNELLGMVGTSITVKGFLCCQNTKLIVYYINGILYKEWVLRN